MFCKMCKRRFMVLRRDTKYCSSACRSRAFRHENKMRKMAAQAIDNIKYLQSQAEEWEVAADLIRAMRSAGNVTTSPDTSRSSEAETDAPGLSVALPAEQIVVGNSSYGE